MSMFFQKINALFVFSIIYLVNNSHNSRYKILKIVEIPRHWVYSLQQHDLIHLYTQQQGQQRQEIKDEKRHKATNAITK